MKKGEKLKALIAKKDINIDEFASHIGVSVSSVFKYYNKEHFDSELLEKFCSELDVPISYFFDEYEYKVSQNAGRSNIMVGRDNNGRIQIDECENKLEDALMEIKHLKDIIDGKDKLIEEKERLINVLMNK